MIFKANNLMNNKIVVNKTDNCISIKDRVNISKGYDYLLFVDENNNPVQLFDYKEEESVTFKDFDIIGVNDIIDIDKYSNKVKIVKDEKKNIIGVITSREIIKFLETQYNEILEKLNNVTTDLEAFMSCTDDVTCISDGSGSKVRISSSCEKYYGVKREGLIGKNVKDLEKNGILLPSATRLVIEEKKPVTITQRTKTGRKLLVKAMPFFDDKGDIARVVSISKDITDEEKLRSELKQIKGLLERYEHELSSLRMANIKNSKVIYRSKAMEKLMEMVNKIALVDSTVLIYGETGVGKEMVAKYIHNISNRSTGPYIKINCGAIPENLLEAELFGYEKGAFTGARNEGKPGLIEIADKGTLFLDEISELPFSLQVKLLRVLQEREFIRVGGIKTINVDVRIIAASNKDLKELVKNGKFRQDLFYRLNVVPITIPPLRERVEDIPILTHYFLSNYNEKYGRSKQITNEVIEAFMKYSWPGNVRELENVIERLIVTSEESLITKKDLPRELFGEDDYEESIASGVSVSKLMPLKEATALVEYQLIKQAIKEGGSTYKAAELLGVDQSTITRKLKKYEVYDRIMN
jgi:PAS domain S-box-containing protein